VFAVSDAQADVIWLEQLRTRGLAWLQWPEGVTAWLQRVRWAGRQRTDWPGCDEAALLADLENWLLPYLPGVRRLQQLRDLDFAALLRQRLEYRQLQELERFAPERFTLPSGHSHAIEYAAAGPPRLAARVQEFYGLERHPAIADGTQPLLLELLSPAHRPVQVTQDLPGFWRNSYPEVRKEMKGRYPKHFWPDEPWAAPATTVTKKRMQFLPE
jgi:ATP-dependent helicase HrpB